MNWFPMHSYQSNKKKVLVLMDMPLFPYRIYCYNELVNRGYDLTVVSISNKMEKYDIPLSFSHKVMAYKWIGPFKKIKGFSLKECKGYDIVIVDPNLRMIDYYGLYNYRWWHKLIGWGHLTGRTSGNKLAEKVRYWFFKKFRALVFYEAGTRDEYIAHGFNPNRLFVANNTQFVDPQTIKINEERRYFLYVGRIQERKGLDIALKAFAMMKRQTENLSLKFVLVGGGDINSLKSLAQEEGITDAVVFAGPEHDQMKLGEWFSHAIAYVSPGHVGLGVLHSFACGVPVITCSGRMHSVEIYNCNNENSMVVPYKVDEVSNAMHKLYTDKEYQKKLSNSAYNHYWENCTIGKMVDGIEYAIKYINEGKNGNN